MTSLGRRDHGPSGNTLTQPVATCYKGDTRPMHPSSRLARLRFGFERLYRAGASSRQRPCAPLHTLLAVPIRERLVLLALIDGTDPREIKALLKATQADIDLTSGRMAAAVATMQRALLDPGVHLEDEILRGGGGYTWADRYGAQIERHLRQLLFASTAVCLFGEAVPPRVAALPLRDRLITYCLVVEELDWRQTQEVVGCTEHAIRCAIKGMQEQVGGL